MGDGVIIGDVDDNRQRGGAHRLGHARSFRRALRVEVPDRHDKSRPRRRERRRAADAARCAGHDRDLAGNEAERAHRMDRPVQALAVGGHRLFSLAAGDLTQTRALGH
jgi:hypothetical protein